MVNSSIKSPLIIWLEFNYFEENKNPTLGVSSITSTSISNYISWKELFFNMNPLTDDYESNPIIGLVCQ